MAASAGRNLIAFSWKWAMPASMRAARVRLLYGMQFLYVYILSTALVIGRN
jgi:hypothetical protein